jgi:hypothetical protein
MDDNLMEIRMNIKMNKNEWYRIKMNDIFKK